jgi:hypothetical protein
MTYGNGAQDDSRQVRDIQDLIAKLADVNKKLALPLRAIGTPRTPDVDPADAPTA